MALLEQIQNYWNHRHAGYSKVNQKELTGIQKQRWQRALQSYLPEDREICILDVGTGPGFFPIILSEMGYRHLTAIDYSPSMLSSAQQNANNFLKQSTIDWQQMDAQQLSFDREQFDVVLTRNLTWNLENPERAYQEWVRVLKPGGSLIVFDANWYAYLEDEALQHELLMNRQQALKEDLEDYWQGEGVDEQAMEEIVRQLPLTTKKRPQWDYEYLMKNFTVTIQIDEQFGDKVWNREEILNYAATPMFALNIQKERKNDNFRKY